MNSMDVQLMARFGLIVLTAAVLGACAPESAPDEEEEEEIGAAEEAMFADNPLVLQDTPAGQETYEDLTRGWLTWALGLPWSTGPVTDPTGEKCSMGQSGSVWYLAGTPGGAVTRSCDVPVQKSLFFPLINSWAAPPSQFVDTPEELADVVDFLEGYFEDGRERTCVLTLRLDGQDLLPNQSTIDEELWVEILEPFGVTVNDDSYSGSPGGFRPAAFVAGHYALLSPLTPGEHTLELGGAKCHGNGQNAYFETSAVYHLHVPH